MDNMDNPAMVIRKRKVAWCVGGMGGAEMWAGPAIQDLERQTGASRLCPGAGRGQYLSRL